MLYLFFCFCIYKHKYCNLLSTCDNIIIGELQGNLSCRLSYLFSCLKFLYCSTLQSQLIFRVKRFILIKVFTIEIFKLSSVLLLCMILFGIHHVWCIRGHREFFLLGPPLLVFLYNLYPECIYIYFFFFCIGIPYVCMDCMHELYICCMCIVVSG